MKGLVNQVATVVPKAHAPAVNTAAIITLAAEAGTRHVLDEVFGSYDASPTAGSLTIALTVEGAAVSLVVAITATGPFDFVFAQPLQGDVGTAITITLAAAGAAVTGKLNALTR